MTDVVCWDADGHTFNVYRDDVLVLTTPFPAGSGVPTALIAIDPDTGVPALYPLAGGGGLLPSGVLGDLLWYGPSGWQALPTTGSDGYLLGARTVGGTLEPLWLPPAGGSTALAPVGGHSCEEVACGSATFITTALVQEMFLWSDVVRSIWSVIAALTDSLHIAGEFKTGLEVVEKFGTITQKCLDIIAAFAGVLADLFAALVTLDINVELAALREDTVIDINKQLYLELSAQCLLSPPIQPPQITQQVLDDFSDWILFHTQLWPGSSSDSYFTTLQGGLLAMLVHFLPIGEFQRWSDDGSYNPTDDCPPMVFG